MCLPYTFHTLKNSLLNRLSPKKIQTEDFIIEAPWFYNEFILFHVLDRFIALSKSKINAFTLNFTCSKQLFLEQPLAETIKN